MKTQNKVGPKRIYPWDSWFGRGKFKVIRGKHFDCQVHSMAAQIRNYASKNNFHVSLGVNENTIDVEVATGT